MERVLVVAVRISIQSPHKYFHYISLTATKEISHTQMYVIYDRF